MDRIRAIFRIIFTTLFNVCYCERCGGAIWAKNVTRCPHCDFRMRDANEKSWGLFALGLIPVIGFIVGIIAAIVCAAKGKSRKAKSAISGALIGLLLVAAAGTIAALAFELI